MEIISQLSNFNSLQQNNTTARSHYVHACNCHHDLNLAPEKFTILSSFYKDEITMIKQTTLTILSKREIEIIKLVAKGYSNKLIASNLFISDETVKKHLRNIFSKLGVSSRIEALQVLGLIR